jgi:hypothetical protein
VRLFSLIGDSEPDLLENNEDVKEVYKSAI